MFSSDDMEEKSEWLYEYWSIGQSSETPPTIIYLTRSKLQYTGSKKNLSNSKIVVKIYCGKITGEKAISQQLSDGRIITNKKSIWEWSESTTF
ncbi:MAG: hypothetical protein HC831_18570 [Chloroflexia bacterium]|nr:hypothetical protein [Chloroflexia bacterium]